MSVGIGQKFSVDCHRKMMHQPARRRLLSLYLHLGKTGQAVQKRFPEPGAVTRQKSVAHIPPSHIIPQMFFLRMQEYDGLSGHFFAMGQHGEQGMSRALYWRNALEDDRLLTRCNSRSRREKHVFAVQGKAQCTVTNKEEF